MPLFEKNESSSSTGSKPAKSGSKFSGNKTWFGFAIVAALGAAALIFGILSQILATTTYYVLNADVPARSQITPDMLTEVSASEGTQPRNALGLDEVTFDEVYAKVELNAGDVLSASNTGDLIPLHQGIPEDFVVASFAVDPNSAVGGKLSAGNYIDVYATSEAGDARTTKSVLRHVLIMDVTASASEFTESEDVTEDTSAQDTLRGGVPFLYTVAVSEEDAAVLANIRNDSVFVTLSNLKSDTKFEDKNIKTDINSIFGDKAVSDSGEGTDPNFGRGEDKATDAPAATTEAPAEETTTE